MGIRFLAFSALLAAGLQPATPERLSKLFGRLSLGQAGTGPRARGVHAGLEPRRFDLRVGERRPPPRRCAGAEGETGSPLRLIVGGLPPPGTACTARLKGPRACHGLRPAPPPPPRVANLAAGSAPATVPGALTKVLTLPRWRYPLNSFRWSTGAKTGVDDKAYDPRISRA